MSMQQFLLETGLDETRPRHGLELESEDHCAELLHHIQVHHYYLGLESSDTGQAPTLPEAAQSWYDQVYLPVREALQEAELPREFPKRTVTELYLWLTYHREILLAEDGTKLSDSEVAQRLADDFSERPVKGLFKTFKRVARAVSRELSRRYDPPRKAP